ncbi:MAG: hypothetical protein KatS3mg130_1011 [Candidatus Sumerlaea sp.]|nr:MAG: hypothetical protein KatS3mg130_1011 [Candidatus Sumerlaea sp.]
MRWRNLFSRYGFVWAFMCASGAFAQLPQDKAFRLQKATASTSCESLTTCIVTKNKKVEVARTTIQPFCPVEYLNAVCDELPQMNKRVVQTILGYPRNGQHSYWWPRKGESNYDGCTTDILYRGQLVMKGEPKGRTYCCGLTLEVLYRVLESEAQTPPLWEEVGPTSMRSLWFCRAINAPGPDEAMTSLGIGRRIENPDEALPGDFVQIWRTNKSGHSVIFISWAFDEAGKRVGMHYWSTQEATGIGFASEVFGDFPGAMSAKDTVISRLLPPTEWKK